MMAAPHTYLNTGFYLNHDAYAIDMVTSGELDLALYSKGQRVLAGYGDPEVEKSLWGQVGVIEVVPVLPPAPGTDTPQPEQTYIVAFPGGRVASLLEHQLYSL